MPTVYNQLDLDRCPHCGVAKPNMPHQWHSTTADHGGRNKRMWATYTCVSCGGVVLVRFFETKDGVDAMYPAGASVDEELPKKAKAYLKQALASAPAGAVMLAASAIDAMLKAMGLEEGSLYSRIDKAAASHLITDEMAKWAHRVRLDANDQRHADEDADLPDASAARQAIEFASALGTFLFVLPARVQRGLEGAAALK